MKPRVLKFRAWINTDGTPYMHYGHSHVLDLLSKMNCSSSSDNVVIMQFTGLYDPEGKPVYEGDVVKSKVPFDDMPPGSQRDRYYEVEFVTERADASFNYHFWRQGPVVGNVYENPELLALIG